MTRVYSTDNSLSGFLHVFLHVPTFIHLHSAFLSPTFLLDPQHALDYPLADPHSELAPNTPVRSSEHRPTSSAADARYIALSSKDLEFGQPPHRDPDLHHRFNSKYVTSFFGFRKIQSNLTWQAARPFSDPVLESTMAQEATNMCDSTLDQRRTLTIWAPRHDPETGIGKWSSLLSPGSESTSSRSNLGRLGGFPDPSDTCAGIA
ncbi:hypothetical protein CC2G_011971 [Coprinopsis cinerea AmutBmut pab1-1]|nr:hypothetical protein CC2G_011971 [Coprinopsis cinerea AmutBmut pab1-1]